MSNTVQLIIRGKILGFPLSLTGRYTPDTSAMLVLDTDLPISKEEKGDQPAAKKLVKEQLKEDKSLFQSLKELLGKKYDSAEKLLAIFEDIRLSDIAIKRDLVEKRTLYHLELYIKLNLRYKAMGLALRSISLDLTLASGEEVLKEEDVMAFKKEVAESKKLARGSLKLMEATAAASGKVSALEKALKAGGESLEKLLDVEKATKNIAEGALKLAQADKGLVDNFDSLAAYSKKLSDSEDPLSKAMEKIEDQLDQIPEASAEDQEALQKLISADL